MLTERSQNTFWVKGEKIFPTRNRRLLSKNFKNLILLALRVFNKKYVYNLHLNRNELRKLSLVSFLIQFKVYICFIVKKLAKLVK